MATRLLYHLLVVDTLNISEYWSKQFYKSDPLSINLFCLQKKGGDIT